MFHGRRNREYWKACDKVHTDGHIIDIQRIPLGSPHFRRQVETFLAANGLRLDPVEEYYCAMKEDGTIAAGAGLAGDLVKCVAVDSPERSNGFLAPLISRLVSVASASGITNLKVFTKPVNEPVFNSLGFHVIARAPLAVLMENGRGLEEYLTTLSTARPGGSSGVIIMNANPFTLGHQYLVGKASESVDRLFVIPVKEDVSLFPYEERLEMIRSGCEGLATVMEGSEYQVSASTFPTYFLKDLSEASETQMLLDLDLFGRHIAPALGVTVRFVGSEPTDPLTARYNELMKQVLPSYGITVVEVPRLVLPSGLPSGHGRVHSRFAAAEYGLSPAADPERDILVSASIVREALNEGHFQMAAEMTPWTTWPYLIAELMSRALMMELEAPLKPGLVDPSGSGAHSDMDYALMKGSVETIRRSFIRHLPVMASRRSTVIEDTATLGKLRGGTGAERSDASGGAERSEASERRYSSGAAHEGDLTAFGKAVERDALEYTGGVNTYRGAIFALGLAAISAMDNDLSTSHIASLASGIGQGSDSHGGKVIKDYNVKGALQMAREGYKPLFEDWLPYFRSLPGDEWRLQKTLLRIMSSLDDTCVIHRVGYDRAQEVKKESKALLEGFSEEGLRDMKARFDSLGVSPGGAADMLALTIFMDSLIN